MLFHFLVVSVEMAAAVAGGAGGGGDPPYSWRSDASKDLPPSPKGNGDDDEEDPGDLSTFARKLCKKCGKHEYFHKGGARTLLVYLCRLIMNCLRDVFFRDFGGLVLLGKRFQSRQCLEWGWKCLWPNVDFYQEVQRPKTQAPWRRPWV